MTSATWLANHEAGRENDKEGGNNMERLIDLIMPVVFLLIAYIVRVIRRSNWRG